MAQTNILRAEIDARLAAIRQAGYPVTLEELSRWIPKPADAENQALRLTNAFAALVSVDHVPDLPARNVRLPALAKRWFQWEIATNRVALARLHEASKFKQARYPVDWVQGWAALFPHLAKAKLAGQLLQREAALFLEERRLDRAVASVATMGSVARSLEWDPAIMSQFVRAGILRRAQLTAERAVNQARLNDAQLTELQAFFRAALAPEPFTRAFVAERCIALDELNGTRERVVSLLETAYFADPRTNEIPALADAFVRNKDADSLFLLEAMEGLIAASQSSEPWKSLGAVRAVGARIQAELERPVEKRLVVSTLWLPQFSSSTNLSNPGGTANRVVRNIALMRTAETAMAVERYRLAHGGELPVDLGTLVPAFLADLPLDPFDGRSLRFKLLPKGYVVYSIGSDGEDNGGKEAEATSKAGVGGTDITFTVERAGEG